MASRRTRHNPRRHLTPVPFTSGAGTSTLPVHSTFHSQFANTSTTSTEFNGSHQTLSPTYHALTPQALYQHEHSQTFLHENPHYTHTVQTHHTNHLGANLNSLGVELPTYVHTKVVQDSVGMMSVESFAGHSRYPYQQYSSYQPIPTPHPHSQPPSPSSQHPNVAPQPEAQHSPHARPSVHGEASNSGCEQMDGRNVVDVLPQQEHHLQTTEQGNATSTGNDFAAIGTQFDSYVPFGYAQTSQVLCE